jgi:hypothetical protein
MASAGPEEASGATLRMAAQKLGCGDFVSRECRIRKRLANGPVVPHEASWKVEPSPRQSTTGKDLRASCLRLQVPRGCLWRCGTR